MFEIVTCQIEHCPTAAFYHEATAKRDKYKVIKKYGLDKFDFEKEEEKTKTVKEGFNDFILAVNHGSKYHK